jgi:hypothetical protein
LTTDSVAPHTVRNHPTFPILFLLLPNVKGTTGYMVDTILAKIFSEIRYRSFAHLFHHITSF